MTDAYRRVAVICTLGYLLFLLLRTAVFSFAGSTTIRYVFLFFAVGAWGASILRSSSIQSLDRFHWTVIGLLLWASISLSWSLDASRTLDRIPSYVLIILILLLIWDTIRSERHVVHGIQVYIVAAAILCILTLVNAVAGVQYLPGRYSGGGYNPNVLATPVALSIPFAWYLFASAERWAYPRVLSVANLGYIPTALLVVLLTASRQAIVATIVALLFVAWDFQRKSRFLTLKKYAILLLFAVSIGLFVMPEEAATRLASIPREIFSGDFGTRLRQWTAGFAFFKQHPFIGIGSGAFRTTIDIFIGYEVAPDSTYLTVLYELGLVGAGLFSIVVLRTFGVLRQFKNGRTRGLWLSTLVMIVLFWFVNDWFAPPTIWILLGLLITHAREKTRSDTSVVDSGCDGAIDSADPGSDVPFAR